MNGLPPSEEDHHHHTDLHSSRETALATPPGILSSSDTFPALNSSTEDWVFGFENDHLEELATQASRTRQAAVPPKESLDTLVNGMGAAMTLGGAPNGTTNAVGSTLFAGYSAKFLEEYENTRRFLEGNKLLDNGLVESLIINNSAKTNNGFVGSSHFGEFSSF